MKKPTRLLIMDTLRKQQRASAMELSRLFGMTRANLRHHLMVLEENKLVEIVDKRQEGRGRPENIYGISKIMLGDGLDHLASALLDEWMEVMKPVDVDEKLQRVAGRLKREFENPGGASAHLLTGIVRFLNRYHYQARWEASATGARLMLGNCPYAAIIDKHPELCKVDGYLLEACYGRKPVQTAKLENQISGMKVCIFLM